MWGEILLILIFLGLAVTVLTSIFWTDWRGRPKRKRRYY